jgi:hypothetical protein
MAKCYEKQEMTTEQLYDLVYTIIDQRPNLRYDVVSVFRKYKDAISAEYWQQFYFDKHIHDYQTAISQQAIAQHKQNLPPQSVYRPKFAVDYYEVRDGYLSIPPG